MAGLLPQQVREGGGLEAGQGRSVLQFIDLEGVVRGFFSVKVGGWGIHRLKMVVCFLSVLEPRKAGCRKLCFYDICLRTFTED